MFLNVVSWIFGGLCLFIAFRLNRKIRSLQNNLDQVVREYYGLSAQISELSRNIRSEIPGIHIALRKMLGVLRFEPEMTVGEALLVHPDAARVLALNVSLESNAKPNQEEFETIREVIEKQGKNLDTMMEQLNGLLDGTTKLLPKSAIGFVPIGKIKRRSIT